MNLNVLISGYKYNLHGKIIKLRKCCINLRTLQHGNLGINLRTLQHCNLASRLGLFCLLTRLSSKNELKMKKKLLSPQKSGLIQMIRMISPFVTSGLNELGKDGMMLGTLLNSLNELKKTLRCKAQNIYAICQCDVVKDAIVKDRIFIPGVWFPA